jgi:hypothetical protein
MGARMNIAIYVTIDLLILTSVGEKETMFSLTIGFFIVKIMQVHRAKKIFTNNMYFHSINEKLNLDFNILLPVFQLISANV